MENNTILQVKDLRTHFSTEDGLVKAVDGVSFDLDKRETLAIVGESGSGKSVTSLSIMRLVGEQKNEIVTGEIIYDNKNILELSEKNMQGMRGNEISMIFQEPMTSLNPVFTVGNQVGEVLRIHQGMGKKQAREKSIEMLEIVGIPNPEKRIDEYPHQLSGGMKQRVMIAIALACNPKILIADEPTTALDVTIQLQILKLMEELKEKFNTSIMLITHDLGVVAQLADNVMVMYAGKMVEYADVKSIYKDPLHPYTKGLLKSIPNIEEDVEKLNIIRGTVPSPFNLPKGCKFCTRCDEAKDICFVEEPITTVTDDNRKVRCLKYQGGKYNE